MPEIVLLPAQNTCFVAWCGGNCRNGEGFLHIGTIDPGPATSTAVVVEISRCDDPQGHSAPCVDLLFKDGNIDGVVSLDLATARRHAFAVLRATALADEWVGSETESGAADLIDSLRTQVDHLDYELDQLLAGIAAQTGPVPQLALDVRDRMLAASDAAGIVLAHADHHPYGTEGFPEKSTVLQALGGITAARA